MARISITVDCRDPDRLVPFWCAALGYVPQPPPEGHQTWRAYYLALGETEESLGEGDACDRIIDPEGVGPAIWFQVVPEPKTTKNRVHLDVHLTDQTRSLADRHAQLVALCDRLLALEGSVRGPISQHAAEGPVCRINDPEGNELCIV